MKITMETMMVYVSANTYSIIIKIISTDSQLPWSSANASAASAAAELEEKLTTNHRQRNEETFVNDSMIKIK